MLIGTLGLSFVFQGRFSTAWPLDAALRTGLALLAVAAIFHPVDSVAALFAAATFVAILTGLWQFGRHSAAA